MKGPMDRARVASIARRMAALCLGIPVGGCAAMTRDVDAYYRQMAVNYQEAIDQAKVDEISVENQARVLAATGDQGKYRKYQRELEKIREWEEHCAWEKKRFEKAATWMESRFKLNRDAAGAASLPAKTSQSPLSEVAENTQVQDIKVTPTD